MIILNARYPGPVIVDKFVKFLEWDTDFFSFPVGRITAAGLDDENIRLILNEARSAGLRCLYFEADPNDVTTVTAVEKSNFHLVDVRVVLEYPFDTHPAPFLRYPVHPDLVVSQSTESDLPLLENIAEEIGQFSRYTFDRNFKPGENNRLYRLWIRKSCSGYADVVYVARWKDTGEAAVGLITCVMQNDIGHIQLAGVHHQHRQKGVGTGLVQTALDWAKGQRARRMQVVTQARNVPAQRLYQQMGFFTRSVTLFYHKWL